MMGTYDYIDIGSSKGGSIRFASNRFGPKGYGIDIDKQKVKKAQALGFDCRWQSVHDVKDKARWVTIMHVLEHLPSVQDVREMLEKSCEIGESVYITYPYFDADGYLYDRGFRFFWSRWTGHTLHLSRLSLHNILTDIGRPFKITRWGKVTDSLDEAIVPMTAPNDSLGYIPEYGKKEYVNFNHVYKEVRAVIGDTSIL